MNWYEPLNQNNNEENNSLKKENERNRKIRKVGIIILAATILLSAVVIKKPWVSETVSENPAEIQPSMDVNEFFENYYTSTTSDATAVSIPGVDGKIDFTLELSPHGDDPLTLTELYQQCSKSIVGIIGYSEPDVEYSWGTGIVLTEDGLILTNTHVISECVKAEVELFGSDEAKFMAKLVGADSVSDLAVLKIDAHGLVPAEFGDSSLLMVGESVAAIGNPLGDRFSLTLTDGIISAIDRGINYNGHSMTLLQTNTALNEGNSGGALFNMYGQVIGITNMKMMSSYSSIEGIGFAIPSSTCKTIIDTLVVDGKVSGRTSIGITVGMIPEIAETTYNLPKGLYVISVLENSDAYKKGIRTGDIITAVNGMNCTTTTEVGDIKDKLSVGDTITFTIYRDGEYFDVDVILMDTNDLYG